MKIKYELSIKDKIAFVEHHLRGSQSQAKSIRANRLAFAVAFSVMGVVGVVMEYDYLIFAGFTVAVLCWFFYPAYHKWLVSKRIAKKIGAGVSKDFRDPVEMMLNGDGLEITDSSSTVKTEWSGIDKISSSEKHTFIYLKTSNALIIPKNAITEGDYEAFIAELKNKV